MGWSEYHLNDPAFCTPLPVMRGLVSAVCERRNAIDSDFHESCTSSGIQAVVERQLTEMLLCSAAEEVPFKEIKKEFTHDPFYGGSRRLSFMHMFDNFLIRMLDGYGGTDDMRQFTNSDGAVVYSSLPVLALALSETLIVPEWFYLHDSSIVRADTDLHVCMDDAWAAQRARMLKLLRYVSIQNGGMIIRYAVSEEYGIGASPQAAYGSIQSWTFVDIDYTGSGFDLECRVEYYDEPGAGPDERWAAEPVKEVTMIVPNFHGCPPAEHGEIRFSAADLRDEGGNGSVFPFDPLCATISSGANTLPLSGGSFASWCYGSASGIGGPDTPSGLYARGWHAGNVKVIFDYDSTYQFKQEE